MQTTIVRRQSEPSLFAPMSARESSGGEIGHFQKLQQELETAREMMKSKEEEWRRSREELCKEHEEELKKARAEKPQRPLVRGGAMRTQR